MDVVGGFPLADGTTRAVCDGLREALARYGSPEQILTDNGKVFTGRFNHPPVEVLFDAICREHGIEHLLTQPRSPTTTGKIERFHRSLRAEFLSTAVPFPNLNAAQALDAWVLEYNTTRPHQSLKMATPAQRFTASAPAAAPSTSKAAREHQRQGSDWVSRRVTTNGSLGGGFNCPQRVALDFYVMCGTAPARKNGVSAGRTDRLTRPPRSGPPGPERFWQQQRIKLCPWRDVCVWLTMIVGGARQYADHDDSVE